MSIENRPNLNAAGLAVDIIKSIEKHKRGNALNKPMGLSTIEILSDDIAEFVEIVDEKLNEAYGE